MDERALLAQRFEEHRPHMRAVAYRMLGSLSEADDAVQDAWLRVSGADSVGIENLRGWLTTVVARVCLNALRARRARAEESLETHVPEPIIGPIDAPDPEQAALLADSVGLALLVVLDTLSPTERLAFVLHDTFAVPFIEIAPIIGRSPAATRQLASRARRRIRTAAIPDADLERQRTVVDAFLAAARDGDFDALLRLLDPEVVVRADFGAIPGRSRTAHGAAVVAGEALSFSALAKFAEPALINGAAGIVARASDGRVLAVMAFTISGGRVLEIDILGDPNRTAQFSLR